MRSRPNVLAYLGGALLFIAIPPGTLRAQEGAGMMQDEKTAMAAVPGTEARPVSGSVTLAQLDRLAGEQLIDVPANVDPSRYSHLLLWSKKTRAVLAVASLPSGATGKMDDKMSRDDKMGKGDKMGKEDKMEPTKDQMQDGSMSKSP